MQEGFIEIAKGRVACRGSATGKAYVTQHVDSIVRDTFQEGDILVTNMTDPSFVPLMKKAGAIVTKIGGITCHAAIISREFGTPCVVSCGDALSSIQSGQTLHVDGESGRIFIVGS